MSYDLMVFERHAAPQDATAFMEWYEKQTEWDEPHDYDNPDVTTPALQNFYRAMIQVFPNMNGPDAPDDDQLDKLEEQGLDAYLTDYSIGKDIIYMAFSWSVADEAWDKVRELARLHQVGFCNVSGNMEIE
ncbi:hypothetical protein CHU32_20805 [Superficieibacter electus]|uniref:Uncharacterized protein n=1 Tax=Superficieibacter electus TaxID=2022662 RepID=A0A2P5GK68_9ENTR|nr:hypothetical protein [Superficieibacter electus]POP43232.1 hypothetical protein CHU33_16885 [Superficieibacter electus]POP44785.1 hypothetical protein CHU32_20805 [Superficieibacter electus]